MEQRDFLKTGVIMEPKTSGLPSQRAPLHLANIETCFSQIAEGSISREQGGGVG